MRNQALNAPHSKLALYCRMRGDFELVFGCSFCARRSPEDAWGLPDPHFCVLCTSIQAHLLSKVIVVSS